MAASNTFRIAVLLVAISITSATKFQAMAGHANTVTETVTLPISSISADTAAGPMFIEMTTVGLSTVTVFNSTTLATDLTVETAPETTSVGIAANSTALLWTESHRNMTTSTTSPDVTTASKARPEATTATTATVMGPTGNATSSKNDGPPVSYNVRALIVGLLAAMIL
ncbi:hypothetical protein QBC47DRAFT_401355 [Echria macrotheca]|uniref:Uncharacterized protein n=1 Tax=Echria macrotheca TaxID=438768 RepID=A0AAJ0BFU4_9PEZI|nr:hypothetical protein QBC47DRAFT_401355 [Echria macrotheca]